MFTSRCFTQILSKLVKVSKLIFVDSMLKHFGFIMYCITLQYINYITEKAVPDSYLEYLAAYVIEIIFCCVVISLTPKKLSHIIKIVLAVIITLLVIIDSYCYMRLGTVINPSMIQLISETNGGEAWEFITGYVLQKETLIILGIYIGHALLYLLAGKWLRRWGLRKFSQKTAVRIRFSILTLMYVLLIVCICYSQDVFFFRSYIYKWNSVALLEKKGNDKFFAPKCPPIFRTYASLYAQELAAKDAEVIRENVEQTTVDTCTFRSSKIILIIGESHNRNHTSIYGYTPCTTPYLNKRKKNKELFIFDNIVTCWNITSQVFRNMMSTHSFGQPGSWVNGTLFPGVFKKAGYHVDFISNEFVRKANQDMFDFSGSFFLNSPDISKYLFDCRNDHKTEFDDGLLNFYDSLPEHKQENRFVIFHLYGQHMAYNKRFPKAREKFTYKDYEGRALTLREKMITAAYDNATLYNDSIINEIINRFEDDDAIVIYLPDHGEEVFDETHRDGRIHSKISAAIARQEYRIPFVIWCSKKYRKTHPKVIKQIRNSLHKPFMTDDLCHILFYLGGIECKYYDEARNLLSPNFDTKRKRILRNAVDYDAVMENEARHLAESKGKR